MIKRLFYSGPSFDRLHEEYAKKGRIDEEIPVKTAGEITILWFKAIDRQVIEPTQEGATRLYIEESFAGVLAPLFTSSEQLKKQHQTWLTALKQAAEKGR